MTAQSECTSCGNCDACLLLCNCNIKLTACGMCGSTFDPYKLNAHAQDVFFHVKSGGKVRDYKSYSRAVKLGFIDSEDVMAADVSKLDDWFSGDGHVVDDVCPRVE